MVLKWRKLIILIVLLFALAGAIFWWKNWSTKSEPLKLGVTFSTAYSYNLGLDPRETFLALLNDLQIKDFRVPIYWSEIEPARGEFDWQMLDFMVTEAARHNAKLTLVIGRKVPRWPECFIPNWAEGLIGSKADEAVLEMEKTVVERYKDNPTVERWQIENEPFFPFGICPAPSQDLLNEEISLVRSLDDRSVMLTVSGEMDPWFSTARSADVLGVSMYRVSYNPIFGFVPYPLTPFVYRFRAWTMSPFLKEEVIISELQAEPWFTKSFDELTGEERAVAFTADDLQTNINFAAETGFSKAYLWGAEWWYLEKLAGRAELWQAAKILFK